ncbi:hypothetical protein [Caballeronia sp. KNU42]
MVTAADTKADDGGNALDDQFWAWVVYEAAVPIAILLLAWGIADFAFDLRHSFLSTFGSGDLLPIAALVLLGTSAEMENFLMFESSGQRQQRGLSKHRFAHYALVLVLAVVYGGMKGKGLVLLDEADLSADSRQKLEAFAVLSIVLTVFALVLAYYSKNKLLVLKVQLAGEQK